MAEVKQLDRAGIEALLPHRDRALMLDRAEVYEDSATGYFVVTQEVCEGHLPKHPILRGVDRIEIIALTLALIMAPEVPEGKVSFFSGASGIRFRSQATVGDEVRAEVQITHQSGLGVRGSGKLFVGDKEICSIQQITGIVGDYRV